MRKKENNYAFIDSQNLNLGIQKLDWKLDYRKFRLNFKSTIPDAEGKIKGNIDADLVLRAALDIPEYDKAVIVSSDGDFYSLVQHLYENNKLKVVLSPDIENCSNLLTQTAREKIWFMNELRDKLEYKKEKHRLRTEP